MKTTKHNKVTKNKTLLRSQRTHQGKNHWHVNKRSTIIVCKFCETKIPIWKKPVFCPNCLDGKQDKQLNPKNL